MKTQKINFGHGKGLQVGIASYKGREFPQIVTFGESFFVRGSSLEISEVKQIDQLISALEELKEVLPQYIQPATKQEEEITDEQKVVIAHLKSIGTPPEQIAKILGLTPPADEQEEVKKYYKCDCGFVTEHKRGLSIHQAKCTKVAK